MGYKVNPQTSKHDIHPLDPVFYYIGSRWLMITIWIASVLIGVWISSTLNDWTWLNRFSTVGILIGTLLTLSPLFRGGIYLSNAEAFGFASLDEDGKTTSTSEEGRAVSINIVIGVILIIISTVINGFGDYFVGLIK